MEQATWTEALADLHTTDAEAKAAVVTFIRDTPGERLLSPSKFRESVLSVIRRRVSISGPQCPDCLGDGWVPVDPRWADQFPDDHKKGACNSVVPCGCQVGQLRAQSPAYKTASDRMAQIMNKDRKPSPTGKTSSPSETLSGLMKARSTLYSDPS